MLEDQEVLKEDRLMLVSERGGDIPAQNPDGLGLYLGDTRYLCAYELRLNKQRPVLLSTTMDEGYVTTIQMVNPTLRDGPAVIPRQTISIRRTRVLLDGLRERIGVQNCLAVPVEIDLSLDFDCDFKDIFDVRQLGAFEFLGRRRPVRQVEAGTVFSYDGLDGARRTCSVNLSPFPDERGSRSATFHLELEPHQTWTLNVDVIPRDAVEVPATAPDFETGVRTLQASYATWQDDCAGITTDNDVLNLVLRRSLFDLRMLLNQYDTGPYPTAGVPWFAVPFGRDGLIVGAQTLALNPEIARGVLRFLAAHRGSDVDPDREEEPGKIMHELRSGELANLHQIPHTPYFGSIDATPLFLVLLAELMRWHWDEEFFRQLEPAVQGALGWLEGASHESGLIEYHGFATHGSRNQGWKDSHDSLTHADGSRAETPAALIEVQAYAIRAWEGLATVYRRLGERKRAAALATRARVMRRDVERFWMPHRAFYAQAIDGAGRQVEVVSSNPGHALWAEAVPLARARSVAAGLLSRPMWTGWGVRTLGSEAGSYNPMSYHNGSVWPHDNSLIADGMRRYGFTHQAMEVVEGILSAAMRLPGYHLPELFCGFERDRRFESRPAEYVVSGRPQAWGAAAAFHLLEAALGLRPDTNARRLTLNPAASRLYRRITVQRLPVAGTRVGFEVTWDSGGAAHLEVDSDSGIQVALA